MFTRGWGMRMQFTRGVLLVVSACLVLGGCGDKNKQPTGQVIATVKGKEITAIDLRNELNGFTTTDPNVRKVAEQQALSAIISRKVLAQAAEKAKVDKSPEFAQQQARMNEVMLVQSWQNQLVKAVPAPSKEETDKFIGDHPDLYANHKVFDVDQVRFARPTDPSMLAAFQPLKSLTEVSGLLASRGVGFQTAHAQLDSLTLDPRVVDQLMKLPPGEVFVVPLGNMLVANEIRATHVEPLPAGQAVKHATGILKSQRTQESLQRQFGSVMAAAKKDISYAKGYQPPAPPKPASTAPPAKAK